MESNFDSMQTKVTDFISQLNSLPKLDLNGRKGLTDYIDFILNTDVTESATSGIDIYNRRFVVLKGFMETNENKEIPFFQTFFERYTNCPLPIMGAGNWEEFLMWTDGGASNIQIQFLTELIKNKEVNIREFKPDLQHLPEDGLRIIHNNIKRVKLF